jgi:hypothetical protein
MSPSRRSPAKDILCEPHLSPSPQLKLEPTPFEICEDGTSMPPSEEKSEVEQAVSPYRNLAVDAVAMPAFHDESSEIADTTSLTFNDDGNIDDTCFSTFSEVPNTDMTTFAKLGQRSPAKQGFPFVQVWCTLFITDAKLLHMLTANSSATLPEHARHSPHVSTSILSLSVSNSKTQCWCTSLPRLE